MSIPTVNWPFPTIQSCLNILAFLDFLQVIVLPMHHHIIFITEILFTTSATNEGFLCLVSLCLYRFLFPFMYIEAPFFPFTVRKFITFLVRGMIYSPMVNHLAEADKRFLASETSNSVHGFNMILK